MDVIRRHLRYNAPGLGAILIRLFRGDPPTNFPTNIDCSVVEDSHVIKEGEWYTRGMTIIIESNARAFFRWLVDILPPSTSMSHEAYGLKRCIEAGMIVLANVPFFWANKHEKNAMLLNLDSKFKIFFPFLTPNYGLAELGELKSYNEAKRPDTVYSRMIKKRTNFVVNGVLMNTLSRSQPSVTTAVGVTSGRSDNYTHLSNICRAVKAAFLESGEAQSQTFIRDDEEEFEIEFKCVAN